MKKTMKKFYKTLISLSCMILFSVCIAVVPDQYKANYTVQSDRDNITRIFIEIQANNGIGVETPTSTFAQLYTYFSNVFPKFPQDYNFQITYQRCLQLTNSLSSSYDYDRFSAFMSLCYNPLSSILQQIDSAYSVRASTSANPVSWPAPLTVTFDARNSVDPSNETIPTDNYFRYYRDTDGVDQAIWIWSVKTYTFPEAGIYKVHLTVRSSNYDKWYFDGEQTLSINVTPKSAIIAVYANNIRLNTLEKQKFGTQEWANWIVFDWSATIPLWWREIKSYVRNITSTDGFHYKKNGDWVPGVIKVSLPKNGEYTVTLTTRDNEWNTISESYSVLISDPVAVIKQNPSEWTTTTNFTFDSSPSYSVMSSLRLFTWEIYNDAWNKMETHQWKTIKYQFTRPWTYTVKLTVEDELWQTNTDTIKVYVESSNPNAQFNISNSDYRTNPSKFYLDASLSSDIDVNNKYDQLYYNRTFSDPNNTNIEEVDNENKKITVSFNSIWTHKIKLTVTDKYGKSDEIEKTIDVRSTLRPEIITASNTSIWWKSISFLAQTNQEVISYTRDFWDGTVLTTQTNQIAHTYQRAGTYQVKLKVVWQDWTENEVHKNIFIWNKDEPIWAYVIKGRNNIILRQNDECSYLDGKDSVTVPAYKVNRYESITIDPSENSTNIQWTKNNLVFYFQEKLKDIHRNSNSFNISFNELWCTYVDLTVEDTTVGINTKQRIWFKVYNNLPTLSNINLMFPQYWNESGIGFNEWYVQDIFNSNFDPLIVKVSAQWAKDPDGFISYFKWYYYYKDDPHRILETKITPSDINYTFFSLPQIPWEFMFGVTMYDNDDGKQSSEEILWNGPIVFFPPDTERPDIPMVTLKVNKTTVDVWDEVTFDVISKIVSDREDFVQERTIMYDFDGDGERDLTTKDDRVSYVYTAPSDIWYVPRAAVLYRWYQWDAKWESIVVKKWLKPRTMFTTAWKFVLFRDISLWEIKSSTTCLSYVDCMRENDWYLQDTVENKNFYFEYPDFGKYYLSVSISDKYANEAKKQTAIILSWVTNDSGDIVNYTWYYKFLSIPEYQENESWDIEISVWKSLDNSVLFYVLYDNKWDEERQCFVDLDLSDNNQKDFYCNEMYFAEFDPSFESIIWKFYYQTDEWLQSKNLIISFLDYSIQLDEQTKVIYNKLTSLIYGISDEDQFKALLINLQKWILNKTENQSNVVAIQEYLSQNPDVNLTDTERDDLNRILWQLTDSTTISAVWWTQYDYAKYEILAILPTNLRVDIEKLFYDFENAKWDPEKWIWENDAKKAKLNEIITVIQSKIADSDETQQADQITRSDMTDIIMPNMCKILEYYNIPSEKCVSEDTKFVDNGDKIDEWWSKTNTKKWLKIVLITIWSIIWILAIMVLLFAIKAKFNNKNEES